jgi:hypothetical protein
MVVTYGLSRGQRLRVAPRRRRRRARLEDVSRVMTSSVARGSPSAARPFPASDAGRERLHRSSHNSVPGCIAGARLSDVRHCSAATALGPGVRVRRG